MARSCRAVILLCADCSCGWCLSPLQVLDLPSRTCLGRCVRKEPEGLVKSCLRKHLELVREERGALCSWCLIINHTFLGPLCPGFAFCCGSAARSHWPIPRSLLAQWHRLWINRTLWVTVLSVQSCRQQASSSLAWITHCQGGSGSSGGLCLCWPSTLSFLCLARWEVRGGFSFNLPRIIGCV